MIVAGVRTDDFELLVAEDETEIGLIGLFFVPALVAEPADGLVPRGLTGQSADTDTIVASLKAYVNALNKLGYYNQNLMALLLDPKSPVNQ